MEDCENGVRYYKIKSHCPNSIVLSTWYHILHILTGGDYYGFRRLGLRLGSVLRFCDYNYDRFRRLCCRYIGTVLF